VNVLIAAALFPPFSDPHQLYERLYLMNIAALPIFPKASALPKFLVAVDMFYGLLVIKI